MKDAAFEDLAFAQVMALSRPGIALDVGANVGLYTAELLKTGKFKVLAFEPLIGAFLMLCQKAAEIGGGTFPANFFAFNAAAGDKPGTSTIHTPVIDGLITHQLSSIVQDFGKVGFAGAHDVQVIRQPVIVVPLDSFAFEPVTFMKIDVEGYEIETLRGARETIARSRPIIFIEIEERHRAGSTTDVPAFLATLGYRGYFTMHGRFIEFDRFDRVTMQRPGASKDGSHIYNFVFVHRADVRASEDLLRTSISDGRS